MKKIAFILFLFGGKSQLFGQSSNTIYDTIRKNEISASFLPALVLFSGYNPVGRYGFYNFGYRHYFKNKKVFRFSVSFAPDWRFRDDQTYLANQDTINIFRSSHWSIRERFQLNIGIEKIFRTKNFMHGFGADLFLIHQVYSYRNAAYWYPTYVDPNSFYAHETYSHQEGARGAIYNGIDSLYYAYDMNDLGLGLQLIYTLRYRINKYFYLSASLGPNLMVIRYNYINQRGNPAKFRTGYHTRLDGNILLISDLSLTFRF